MSDPQLRRLAVGSPVSSSGSPRQLAWWDWPCADASRQHVVVCAHGLSRQGRDFDALARALQPRCRVVAFDAAGRGHSDRLADPMGYQLPTYATDAALLLSELRRQQPDARIDWVGTSMGGLIGMALAAQPALAIGRLVLNDVGPIIQLEALQRIGTYLGQARSFDSEQQAVDYLASISQGFGPHTPDQWRALSLPMLREREGRWHLHYDPALALPVKALLQSPNPEEAVRQGEAALWQLYDAIRCPTLLLRGAQSDLLSEATVAQMQGRGPHPTCVRFEGVGHAPTLVSDDQIAAVRDFLWAA
jgi:pimeloyl-ACP methyl ester carboxylesterase